MLELNQKPQRQVKYFQAMHFYSLYMYQIVTCTIKIIYCNQTFLYEGVQKEIRWVISCAVSRSDFKKILLNVLRVTVLPCLQKCIYKETLVLSTVYKCNLISSILLF